MESSILKPLDPTAYYTEENSRWEIDTPCSGIEKFTFYQLRATQEEKRMQTIKYVSSIKVWSVNGNHVAIKLCRTHWIICMFVLR